MILILGMGIKHHFFFQFVSKGIIFETLKTLTKLITALLPPVFISFTLVSCSDIQYQGKPLAEHFSFPYKLKNQFTLERTLPNEYIIPEDFDGDGNDEFIRINNRTNDVSMIVLRTLDHKTIDGVNDTALFKYVGKIDFDRDGNFELLFTLDKKNQFELILVPTVTGASIQRWVVCPKREIFTSSRGRIGIEKCLFHPHDPSKLLLVLNTAFTSAPRHILLYDFTKSQIVSHLILAPLIHSICWGKFSDPNQYQILLGTYAAGNGARYQGLDDYHSWLILADQKGNILYQKSYGDFGSLVWISPKTFRDVSGEEKAFIVRYHYGKKQPGPDFVGIWSWEQRRDFPKIFFPQGIVIRRILQTQNIRTGKQEIICLLKDGTVVSIDQDLKITRSKKLDFLPLPEEASFLFADNLMGDYQKEYVLQDKKYRYLLSNNFDLLCRTSDILMYKAAHLNNYPYKLLIHKDKNDIFRLSSLELNPLYYLGRMGLILLIVGIMTLLYSARTRIKKQREYHQLFQKNAFQAWVLENLDLGVILFDKSGKIKSINRKARELLQLPLDLPTGLDSFEKAGEILKNERLRMILDIAKDINESQKPKIKKELEITTDSSLQRWLVSGEVLQDEKGRPLGKAISIKDISQIIQGRELLAWIEFAGKLAHEVKTPLSSMLLASEKIQKIAQTSLSTHLSQKIQKYLAFLFKDLEHVQSISESLMQITSLNKKEIQEISVNRIIRECIDKLQITELKNIHLDLKLAEDLPKISGDFNQLSLAVINILKNSIEAMEEGDTIHIYTYLAHGLHNGKYPEREYVVMEIADTGAGIPEEYKKQIFQPYFSRKENGTGLGLPIAQKIIEDHHGAIFFESQENIGTVFWIYLPISKNN